MLWLLALQQERVATLAYHGAERMYGCRDCWRSLPRADTSAVHERSKRVSVVAWTLEDFCSNFVRV